MKKKKNMFTVSSRLSALVLGLSISVVFLSSCNKSQSSISEKNEKEAASTDLSGNQDDEKDSNDSFTFPDITSMDAIVGATAIHLMDKNITYWEPSCKNAEDFWDVMCFYMGAEEGITNMDPEPPRAGKDGEYYVFPNSVWVNAGYACFPDFDGSLPEIGGKIWRALKVDQDHTGVAIGDTSRFEMISYTENEDHTVDAVYRYDGWEESRDYKMHMSINENYDKANDNFTYYYTIERVEEINSENTDSNESENDSWKQSYIDFIEMDQDITREADRCTFGLIYLNNDDIPDLICDFKDTTSATFIISFRDDQLDSIIFYRSGGIQYYEREGLIYNSCNSEEGIFDELAYLGDEGFQDLGKGFRYNDSHKSPEHAQFYWNDEEVSEEEYNNMINKIDPQKSKKWNTYSEEFKNNNYSRDEILQYLREN